MKKVYLSEKWKKYSKQRSKNELRKKQRKGKERSQEGFNLKQSRSYYKNVRKLKKGVSIKAPINFSLINNPDESLDFFDAINEHIRLGKDISIDLSQVEALTTDAILYLLSRLEYRRVKNSKSWIRGNEPVNEECREILKTSGFYYYIHSKTSHFKPDTRIFSITSDTLVQPSKAKEVKDFVKKCLGKEESKDLKNIYEIIMESMTNVKHHAYTESIKFKKWWLMASFQKDQNKVCFTLMDNGLGIPKTLRKKKIERVKTVVGVQKDDSLILSALKGDFLRTQTGKAFRGKGLPKIYEIFQSGKIKDLKVISKWGYIDCSADIKKTLKTSFHGTLLYWEFV